MLDYPLPLFLSTILTWYRNLPIRQKEREREGKIR